MNLGSFLTKGYLPKELPPCFNSTSFENILTGGTLPAGFPQTGSWELGLHSLARTGGVRRSLALVNPVAFLKLGTEIVGSWNDLNTHIAKSKISISKPSVRNGQSRAAVPKVGLGDLVLHKINTRARGQYLLQADIAECYRSIYTHSIPWALHTKPTAKANKFDMTFLGNRLDKVMQQCQDGQTNGIPIGPDTSLVVAEVVLAIIDAKLTDAMGPLVGYRYYDDFHLVFQTATRAEETLGTLEVLLWDFGLHLHPGKTRVIPLPDSLEDSIPSRISNFALHQDTLGPRWLIRFFDYLFDLKVEARAFPIVGYGLSRIEGKIRDDADWKIAQPLMAQAVAWEPSAMPQYIRMLVLQSQRNREPDATILKRTLNNAIMTHAPQGHGSEVAWALWGAMLFDVRISRAAAQAVSRMTDSVVALLALDAEQRGTITQGLDKSGWATVMTTADLRSENWLLSYEAGIKGWLPSVGAANHIAGDPAFQRLENAKVSFYRHTSRLTQRLLKRIQPKKSSLYG